MSVGLGTKAYYSESGDNQSPGMVSGERVPRKLVIFGKYNSIGVKHFVSIALQSAECAVYGPI